jgi:hypothetical protein
LTSLDLEYNKNITNQGISLLTNLTFLDLTENNTITSEGILSLPNLQSICLKDNKKISMTKDIKQLLDYLYMLKLNNISKSSDLGDLYRFVL